MWIAGIHRSKCWRLLDAPASRSSVSAFRPRCSSSVIRRSRRTPRPGTHVDWVRLGLVIFTLALAIIVNVVNTRFNAVLRRIPFLGRRVWVAIVLGALLRGPTGAVLPAPPRGSLFC